MIGSGTFTRNIAFCKSEGDGYSSIDGRLSLWTSFPAPMYPQPLVRIVPDIILNNLCKSLSVSADVGFVIAGSD
jgi:hypothetical protein